MLLDITTTAVPHEVSFGCTQIVDTQLPEQDKKPKGSISVADITKVTPSMDVKHTLAFLVETAGAFPYQPPETYSIP